MPTSYKAALQRALLAKTGAESEGLSSDYKDVVMESVEWKSITENGDYSAVALAVLTGGKDRPDLTVVIAEYLHSRSTNPHGRTSSRRTIVVRIQTPIKNRKQKETPDPYIVTGCFCLPTA